MAGEATVRIIEKTGISPPSGSVSRTHLPLTFFDYPWLTCTPQRLFFFDLPKPTDYFTLTVIPKLKSSLSTALIDFFPFAADIIVPQPPQKPHLLFDPERAAVSFTTALSGADFYGLASDEPREVAECGGLVPDLQALPSLACCGRFPLLAVQVTVFPNVGFTIGVSFGHAAADGKAFNHFVKSWASICKSESTSVNPPLDSPPCHDRGAIVDEHKLEPIFLETLRAQAQPDKVQPTLNLPILRNKVRATFVMGRAHIESLKKLVALEVGPTVHVSSFVVTVALTWANLVRSRQETNAISENETHHVCFSADCRNRKGPENPIPSQYFGNCLAICYASVNGTDLIGENGVFHAARAIGETVRDLESGVLRGGEMWMKGFIERSKSGNMVTVAGSPSLGVYRTDFGWGCPRKSVSVHIDVSGAMSMAECVGEGGGMEIGLALDEDQMKRFSGFFERSLELL